MTFVLNGLGELLKEEATFSTIIILSNPSMPVLVKIGKTSRGSVLMRLGELYSTGVPVPFECEFAGRVDECQFCPDMKK